MNLTSLPIIGSLIQKGENALAAGVQNIKMKVADFHLVPRRIANFRARSAQLRQVPAVVDNTYDIGTLNDVNNKIVALGARYDSVNAILDTAMNQVNQVQAGNVSVSAVGVVASAAQGMNEVMSSANTIDNMLASIEQRVLTPQQMAARSTLGVPPVVQVAGMSKGLVAALVIGGGIAMFATGRRGRR